MALHARLAAVSDNLPTHPGYSNAQRLLNEKFRAASAAQRVVILESARWLIEVLDTLRKSVDRPPETSQDKTAQ